MATSLLGEIMPPKKKPKLSPGQLRGIVKTMDQPPFGSRKRTRVSQKKLVTRSTRDATPKSGPVKKTETGVKKTPSTLAAERAQRARMRLERMSERLQRPSKSVKAAPTQKIMMPRGIPLKEQVTGTGMRGVMYRGRLVYLSPGQITALTKAGKLDAPRAAAPDNKLILKRDFNLTPMARERFDAEQARLAREERLSANKQYEESKRNPRVQNPMREPQARRIADQQAIEGIKAIKKAEKEKARRQKKPLRPKTTTPVGRIPLPPIMGSGGTGMKLIK
jgi:hypothetical protein